MPSVQQFLSLAPGLTHHELGKVLKFISLSRLAIPSIRQEHRKHNDPSLAPERLPQEIQTILENALDETPAFVQECWLAFKEQLWCTPHNGQTASHEDIRLYNQFALPQKFSYRHIYPPLRTCNNPECSHHKDSKPLDHPLSHAATLFTLREGALPVYTTSLYCRGCQRRYHHNYAVHKSSETREYYFGVPDIVQVTPHYFFESALLEYFATSKVFAWVSSLNCARIYNESLASLNAHILNNLVAYADDPRIHETPVQWKTSLEIRDEYVLDGFFLYSLMLDKAERGNPLLLRHDTTMRERLKNILNERNKEMEGTGQEQYGHACDLCFILLNGPNGEELKIQAAVCDGITLGHPCCAIHDCKEPLEHHRRRYCSKHAKTYEHLCAVIACKADRVPPRRTCEDREHQALEDEYVKKGKAMFQLQGKLKRAGLHVPLDPLSTEEDPAPVDDKHGYNPEEDDYDENPGHEDYNQPSITVEPVAELGHGQETNTPTTAAAKDPKAPPVESAGQPAHESQAAADTPAPAEPTSKHKLKVIFGRRRTHNQQLIMRPCGVILSRATFFGSESISAAFAKATFPTPRSTPEFFIFDNNCQLDAHQKKQNDMHFANTGKPVDVFHFNTKHKESDTHCQRFCNPAAFPELIDGGNWRFNTSICEQTNVWLGGYLAILRDMEATRFSFYLDEMIKRRNRYIVKSLETRGKHPWNIPIAAILQNTESS
ncbi:hypothetical protein NLJ89_g6995 [Agrocybe chaxingu]|uniref:CxC5 like cysteine cluster associated with KDZ domain-containing protein n=1 Tax=Agrocybe chaxingu TaxID=84603 RepID=A0A9W8K5C8_9AGAR|nr:hypothetical protein NLJ89_g6995 [Agrocybe chaxingu]